jgi:hypothetical protein
VSVFLFLGGCASQSAQYADKDEQIDLYLSTMDDKHFVWCTLDLDQCQSDFEKWKFTPRGRTIITEFEKEDTGQTYNTHNVPHVFRTHFVDESQLTEKVREQEYGHDSGALGNAYSSIDQHEDILSNGMHVSPKKYGPELPSKDGTHAEGYTSR